MSGPPRPGSLRYTPGTSESPSESRGYPKIQSPAARRAFSIPSQFSNLHRRLTLQPQVRFTRDDIFPLAFFATIWVVAPIIAFCVIWQTATQYRLGAATTFVSLFLAFTLLLLLESSASRPEEPAGNKRRNTIFFRLFLASAIGVCTGIAMLVCIGLFSLPQWIVAAIALPAGIAIFVLCCLLAR